MSELKQWAAVKNDFVVHGGFDAPEELVAGFPQQFSDALDNGDYVPPWYDEGVVFVDVTGVEPRPVDGFYRDAKGAWIDGTPKLTVDRVSIPADNTTPVAVTYRSLALDAPSEIVFWVNGVESDPVPMENYEATIGVVSDNPGDMIVVEVRQPPYLYLVDIKVEG